jgi:hypothetical protein
MKVVLFSVFTLISAYSHAQGTIEFISQINGGNALPSNPSSLQTFVNEFLLYDNRDFTASFLLEAPNDARVSVVRIYQSETVNEIGTALFDFELGYRAAPLDGNPGAQQYKLTANLSENQAADLLNGNWWVNVHTIDFPNGEIRGRLTAVPEPSTVALVAFGVWVLLSRSRPGKKR